MCLPTIQGRRYSSIDELLEEEDLKETYDFLIESLLSTKMKGKTTQKQLVPKVGQKVEIKCKI